LIIADRDTCAKGTIYFQYLECYNLIYLYLSAGIMRFPFDWFDDLMGGHIPSPTPTFVPSVSPTWTLASSALATVPSAIPVNPTLPLSPFQDGGVMLYSGAPAWNKTARASGSR